MLIANKLYNNKVVDGIEFNGNNKSDNNKRTYVAPNFLRDNKTHYKFKGPVLIEICRNIFQFAKF